MYFLGIIALASIQVASAGFISQVKENIVKEGEFFKAKSLHFAYPKETEDFQITKILDYLRARALDEKPIFLDNEKIDSVCNAVRRATGAKVSEQPLSAVETKQFIVVNGNGVDKEIMLAKIRECSLSWRTSETETVNLSVHISAVNMRLKKAGDGTFEEVTEAEKESDKEAVFFFADAVDSVYQGVPEKKPQERYIFIDSVVLVQGEVEQFHEEPLKVLSIDALKNLPPPSK